MRPYLPSLPARRSLCALALAGCALLAAACGEGEAMAPRTLRSAVEAGEYALGSSATSGWVLAGEPRVGDFTSGYERRPAVITAGERWRWTGTVPTGARLQVGSSAAAGDRLVARLVEGARVEVLAVDRRSLEDGEGWLDVGADLSSYAGREVTIELALERAEGAAARADAEVAWGPVMLRPALAERHEGPPNLVFILVDTLRYDRLSSYGYERDTTPRIDALLAERGVLLEDAYAQAPWTLPSVASYLTGRYPGEVLGESMAAFGIPPEVRSLPEVVRGMGYATGGFYANPALYRGNGFDRGFDTAFTPPAELDWFTRHADDLNARMIPWLEAHQHLPFFLYAHYLDPHDPYDNPDIVDDRSPFYPDYPGHLNGRLIHGIYGGYHKLIRPAEDVKHINALYDSEVAYVDRYVGRLLEAIDPAVLDNTLVVFTSDHGEELFDHGGWKHGQTLYEEQIHVPLIFRWDRRFPAGQRLRGSVELVDLMPTLIAALGGELDPAWQGRNLLPALEGREPLPRRPAFAQHLSSGPLRAASVLDGRKLILFNRREPFAPPDKLQEHLWRKDLERLEDVELYDLDRDRVEQTNLAAGEPGALAALAPVIHHRLEPRLPGLRVIAGEIAPGSSLALRLTFERSPSAWWPYFLAPGDRVELDGRTLAIEWRGGEPAAPGRGVRVAEDFGRVESIAAALDGEPLPSDAVSIGAGLPYRDEALGAAALTADVPPSAGEATLRIWLPASGGPAPAAENEETRRRLKALGYL